MVNKITVTLRHAVNLIDIDEMASKEDLGLYEIRCERLSYGDLDRGRYKVEFNNVRDSFKASHTQLTCDKYPFILGVYFE